jgi:hypothetical protein
MHNTILNFAALRIYSYKTAYRSIDYKKIDNYHPLNSISLLPNGNIISLEKGGETVIIWDAKDFSFIAKAENRYPFNSLIVIPNGNVITNSDTEFKTWDTNNGFKCVGTNKIEGYEHLVSHILLSNGYLAYTAIDSKNCYILIIDHNNEFKCIKKIDEYNYWTTAVVNLPSDRFASGHNNGSISFWSVTKGYERIRTIDYLVLVTSLLYIDERKLLLSGHGHYNVKVWNIESYLCVKTFITQSSVNGFLFLPFCYFAFYTSTSLIKIISLNNKNDNDHESYVCVNSYDDDSANFKSALLLKNNQIALVLNDGSVSIGLLN